MELQSWCFFCFFFGVLQRLRIWKSWLPLGERSPGSIYGGLWKSRLSLVRAEFTFQVYQAGSPEAAVRL